MLLIAAGSKIGFGPSTGGLLPTPVGTTKFHAQPPATDVVEYVQIPVVRLEIVGGLLAAAILLLVGITIYVSWKRKKKRPWRP